ncbi:MAG: OB-fold domain-containing protein [Frankia sp.]|nr:OB-fold domain-containing protein [Frankia sp.]
MTQRRPDRVLGGPHDAFWRYCEQGELRMQRCGACQHLQWPPVDAACERCASTDVRRWDRLSGRGHLVSWCVFERAYYQELPVPWDTILVELAEGPLVVANPHGFRPGPALFGARVEARFTVCADGAGEFHLPVFALVEPPAPADG